MAAVEQGLEPLLAADRRDMEAALTPLERAKVHVTLANAVSTLFCSASPPRSPLTHSFPNTKYFPDERRSRSPRARLRWHSSRLVARRGSPRPCGRPPHPFLRAPRAVYLKTVGLEPAEHAVGWCRLPGSNPR